MPLYEYRCRACGHQMEVLQKVSDPPKRRCEKCSGRVDKLVSRTAFLLKGGGWYAEGYGKSSAGAKGEGSDKGAGESAGEKASPDKKTKEGGSDSSDKKGKTPSSASTRKAAAG